jgi:hypothetical protein
MNLCDECSRIFRQLSLQAALYCVMGDQPEEEYKTENIFSATP